jgi:DNA polymerase-3 subunit delta
MAERKTAVTFDSIMRDLKSRNFSPIYILMGDESYYIDRISDYIAENVLRPEERDFNQSIVFGSDVNIAQIIDLAKGYPMMAEYRVVIVKESQNLKATELLEKYFEKPVKSTILVFCHKNGTIDRRKK